MQKSYVVKEGGYRVGFLSFLNRNFTLIVYVAITALVLSLLCYAVVPRRYSSYVTILPSSPERRGLDAVQGGMLGVSLLLNLSDDSSSLLALYPEILRSRKIGMDILKKKYRVETKDGSIDMTLMDYIGKKNEDAALLFLNSRIASFWIDNNSKTFVIKVTTDDPELSSQIAAAYLERLEHFNRMERRSTSRDVYEFVKGRFEECGTELAAAEKRLKEFREKHREFAFSASPELQMEHRRLIREVELKQALYVELGKELKSAEIEMEKDTPVLNVLDIGEPSIKPEWPVASRFIPGVTAVGLIIGLLLLFLVDTLKRYREGEVKEAVDELLRGIREDVKLLSNGVRT